MIGDETVDVVIARVVVVVNSSLTLVAVGSFASKVVERLVEIVALDVAAQGNERVAAPVVCWHDFVGSAQT